MQFTDNDWLTPIDVLRKFGQFDLDPCMSVVRPWDTARVHYNIIDNGLIQRWFGRIWLNPPYSDMDPWIAKLVKAIKEGATGMGLYNARLETAWCFAGVWNLADSVFIPKGRFKFFRPDGGIAGTGKMGSIIAAYSEADSRALYDAQLEGKFIVLRFRFPINIKTTWRALVRAAMQQAGNVCTLEQLYELVSGHPKTETNPNWKAKVRQQVQQQAVPIKRGQWELPLT